MAVASDLPSLDSEAQYRAAENSVLYPSGPDCQKLDAGKCPRIAKLTGNLNRILVNEGEISPNLKNAVIAIEDRRFYSHKGVDYTGIARALSQDVLRRQAAQGGSTITQQFVKNALSAQGDRSVFQKLREAALAYHLERKWSKEKILTQYLNTVYFGNGAYGVEAAARTYFGDGDEPDERASATDDAGVTLQRRHDHGRGARTRTRASRDVLSPAEAALLAGMISSPSMYDPLQHPRGRPPAPRPGAVAHARPEDDHAGGVRGGAAPGAARRGPGRPAQRRVRPALLHELGDRAAARPLPRGAGLQRRPADQDDDRPRAAGGGGAGDRRPAGGHRAERLARRDREQDRRGQGDGRRHRTSTRGRSTSPPTGTASRARRSSRSSSRARSRTASTRTAPGPRSRRVFPVPGSGGKEKFPVSNYEDSYLGTASLWSATATSDNSVFAELGLKIGTKRIARLARADGHPHQAVDQPGDDARRPQGGRDAARDGLRLLDDRERRHARRRARFAPDEAGPVGFDEVKGGTAWTSATSAERVRVFPQQVGAAREGDARTWSSQRHRQGRPGRRRVHLGQDRHHRELRRRLVRGRQRRLDRRRLGRLRGQGPVDGVPSTPAARSRAARSPPRSSTTS